MDFALPYDAAFLQMFRPENVVPTGFEVSWHRIFISTPRLRAGVPATLSFIPRDLPLGSSPQLQAYPSWDWHLAGKGNISCSTIISVYRTKIDKCNRLWVLDAGVITSIDDFRPVCPPKMLVFDLQTDTLVRLIHFPREILRPHSLLTNFVMDDTSANSCDDVFVYIADTTAAGMLVLDGTSDRSWRVTHSSMFPNPDSMTYRIGEDIFELPDGIIGLGFSANLGTVYFNPLASDRLFSVPTSALQAGTPPFGEQLPVTFIGRKSSQGPALTVDTKDDSIIFSPLTETAIAAWHPLSNDQRILAYNPEQLQFVAELKFIDRDRGNLWMLSTKFQKFFLRKVDARQSNIRIMRLRPQSHTSHNGQYDFPNVIYNNNTYGHKI